MRFNSEVFESNDDNLYFDVPKYFFNVFDDSVYVSTNIVPLLTWNIIDEDSTPVLIQAKEQRIQIRNDEYFIKNLNILKPKLKKRILISKSKNRQEYSTV